MSLFWLIYKATVEKDLDAAWKIIAHFESLIDHKSVIPFTKKADEDLKSEMQLILLTRILNFDIMDQK